MRRDKFPEKVPFRLTRMLIKAMEVSGIEGNYRITCENTMRVLRASKDSLMAILEAFVYDPLISFKLLAQNLLKNNKTEETKTNKNHKKLNRSHQNEALDKIKNSIVEHVLVRMKDSSDFPASKFSKFKDSLGLQSVIEEAGGVEVIKQEEEILNETAEVVVNRIASKLKSS